MDGFKLKQSSSTISSMNEQILEIRDPRSLIGYEPFLTLIALLFFAWFFYRLFLREITAERHKNLRRHFQSLAKHSVLFSTLFTVFKLLSHQREIILFDRFLTYLALIIFVWGAVIFVKTSRLIILQYLFLGSMKAGVPVLLVNIFSLLMSLTLFLWSASFLFGIKLGPLLATSAAFSIILGLALQDTLGNLFAGISIQFDRSFEIGDWIEIVSGAQKIVGQVKEITWRATSLSGWSDEIIVLPNRTLANSQISNFHSGDHPIIRSQIFRLPLHVDINKAKSILLNSLQEVKSIRNDMGAFVYVAEITDSWFSVKLAYFIDVYSAQFITGDEVMTSGLEALRKNQIPLARQIYELHQN